MTKPAVAGSESPAPRLAGERYLMPRLRSSSGDSESSSS